MKVIFLATLYEYGGLSSIIRNIVDNLDREKFDDVVFVVERLAPRHYPLREDIKFVNIDIKTTMGYVGKLVNIFRHLCRIRKIVICERPDVVVSFGFTVNCLYLLSFLWPANNRAKIVLSEYTEQPFVKQRPMAVKGSTFNFIYRITMFFLYCRADAIICVSNSLAKHISGFFLMDSRKIKVIPVSVNIEEIRIHSHEELPNSYSDINSVPCVGTVSRLSAEKGVDCLIEAFSYLTKRTDAKLVIVGEGEERGNLEKMVKDFKIDDKVSFLGWVENPYNLLRKMDVFVLSSLWEGFPNVIVESMVCGVPVVATRSVDGMDEVIRDGIDGLLVPPRDTKALSDSIYTLLRNKELRDRLTKEATAKIEQFDACRVIRHYESLILGLVNL